MKKAAVKAGTKKKGFRSSRAEIRARGVMMTVIENPRISLGEAMQMNGYAPATAENPSKNLTSGRTWNELLAEYLPENEILDAHKSLLRASNVERVTIDDPSAEFTNEYIISLFEARGCNVMRTVRREKDSSSNSGRESIDIYFWSPDNRARKDALDMFYKLRGSYMSDKIAAAPLVALGTLNQVRESLRAAPVPKAVDDGL